MPLLAGTRLGPYEVAELLGAGGMGAVYRARDPRLGRDVAIKVLPDDIAADPDRLRRFEQEARAVAALNHPHILTVHDVGTHDGTPYVVTELLKGETLREVLSRRSPTQRQVLAWAVQTAQGLAAAHRKGIVHRDLKPENLFLTTEGRVKILDFGLAKLTAAAMDREEATESSPSQPGMLMGTVAYMSPEQVQALAVDARSDLFSFGVVLYELLARKHPFRRETVAATLTAILQETPPELTSVDRAIPPAVDGIVRRCLEKRREERFQGAHDLALALEAVLAAPTGAASLQEVEETSPYPGLRPFTEKDAGVFFGREGEVKALWERIRSRRLLGVIGPSGVGKSSLVRAGLAASRPQGWSVLVCTPGASAFRGLGQALLPALAGDLEALPRVLSIDDPAVAFDLLGRWRRASAEALLVVDQFEELFTLNPKEVQARFAALLGRLAAEADVHVVLALRDDFLIRCSDEAPLAPVFESLTPLTALSPDGLRRAVVEPARKRGYRFDDATLVDEMVSLVEGVRGALPLLAFAVARLWEKRDREKKLLTREAYREIAGVEGALAQHAEATLDRIGSERQGLVREVFRNLVTAQGTRAVIDREELLSAFPDRAAADEVLGQLVDARLLTSYEVEGKEGEPSRHRIEVVHESLLKAWPRLVRWQTQDEDGAQLRDQLKQAAHLWDEKGRTSDLLWTGTAYQEYELWRQRYPGALTALEEGFARAMAARALRQRRLRRWVGVGIAATLAVVLAVVSVLWRRAVLASRRAEAARVMALGRVELDRYPTAALAYARKSLEIADTPAARAFAVEALWRSPSARVLPVPNGGTWRAAWSPDGHRLAAYTFSEYVVLFPEDGGPPRKLGGFRTPSYPPFFAFSPKGDALLTFLDRERRLRLTSVEDGREICQMGPDLLGYGPWPVLGFIPTGDGIAMAWPEAKSPKSPTVWNLWPWDGGAPKPLAAMRPVQDAATDRERRWLALVRDGRVILRPFAGGVDTPEREVASFPRSTLTRCWISPRGDRLAVREHESGRMTVFNLDPKVTPRFRVYHQSNPELQFDGWSDESVSRLVWGSASEAVVSLWDLGGPPDAAALALRRPGTGDTKQAIFDPRGNWLSVANFETLTFWAVSQPWVRLLRGHTAVVNQLRFTPDSRGLVSCANDNARRWPLDPAAGEAGVIENLGSFATSCYGIAVSPDGTQVLRGFGGVKLVNLHGAGGRWLVTEKWPTDYTHDAAAFDPSGRWAAAGVGFARPPTPKVLRVWELPAATLKHEWPLLPPGETESPYGWGAFGLAFVADGRILVSGGGGLRCFDIATGRSEWLWRIDRGSVADTAVTSDQRLAVAAGFSGPEGKEVWAPPSVFELATRTRREIHSHGNRIRSVAVDPGGRFLVTGDAAGVVRVGPIDGSEPHLLPGHGGPVTTVAVSPDGKWIASAAGSEIRLWPMPDVSKPPLHTLPYAELMAKLQSLTNLRVVEDAAAALGYKVEVGPFPGWKDVPTW